MKVAISFSGLPRLIPSALECWKQLILQHNADVFIHVWKTSDESTHILNNFFNPVKIVAESQENFDVSAYNSRLQSSNPQNVFSMWTSLWRSMHLVYTHTTSYDIVVRARYDVAFEPFDFMHSHGIIIPGKPAEIYSWQGKRYPGWHDMMAYGDIESMRTYSSTLWKIPKIYAEGSPFFSEFFLSTNLFRSKINTTHHAIYADIIR